MAISGPQALNSLEDALRDIRREEDEIAKRLARSNERISKFREAEVELFRKLALVRLDPQSQQALTDRISQSETRARIAMKQHAGSLASTEATLQGLDAEVTELTAKRGNMLAEVDARQAELKALSSRIAVAIGKDPAYAQKRKAADELAGYAAESLRKTQQAEADREQKGRPYRDDPLFSYLWARGYGTSTYKAGNFSRWLDGLVADLIGYGRARPNFAMLNEIPLRLREHADRQSENAARAEAEIDAMEESAIDAAGGGPIRAALSAAQAGIAAIDARLLELEDQRDDVAQRLRQLAEGKDPAFEKALAAFAEGLGREDLQALLAEARRTATAQDDTLVAQIDDARARIREEDVETRDQRQRLKTLAARRRELEDISYEFKKARFDDPRSTFRDKDLVGDVLNDFLRGSISAADYWGQWRRSQNWSAGTSDWGGGYGLPRNGRSPWGNDGGFRWPDNSIGGGRGGGGFSRPRGGSGGFRTGGGTGSGGGFKTGGGF